MSTRTGTEGAAAARWRQRRVTFRARSALTTVQPLLAIAIVIVGYFSWCEPASAASGLRWTGDARVAADARGAVLGGPALRFRYGVEFRRPPESDDEADPREDGWVDLCLGSWLGFESSAGLLVGRAGPERLEAATVVGFRPWLSRRQQDWFFLHTERVSLLGALLPEVGAVFGLASTPRWYLGWELPLGGESFQIVPGLLWISPGTAWHAFGSVALRVPM